MGVGEAAARLGAGVGDAAGGALTGAGSGRKATAVPMPPPATTTAAVTAATVCVRVHAARDMSALLGRGAGQAPARPWHILYFLPDPHGHGALRPTFANSLLAPDSRLVVTVPSSPGAE